MTLQLELSSQGTQLLEDLKKKAGVFSEEELINRALTVYEWALERDHQRTHNEDARQL